MRVSEPTWSVTYTGDIIELMNTVYKRGGIAPKRMSRYEKITAIN
jgi:hypothetical protein